MLGKTISHYEVVDMLGEGGMGRVYRARDTVLQRTVALKVLTAERGGDAGRRRRFLREARAVSALAHPNIVTVYDVVQHEGNDCLVMEFVDGRSLAESIPAGGLPVERALRYAGEIAKGVGAAHAAGIVHRDLKPANVMITRDERIKVLDFGLAKRGSLGEADAATATVAPLTREGAILGTPEYMSPEQALGRPVDARSDVFSLGAILYEMLTGARPFAGDSAVTLLHDVAFGEPRPPRELRGELPGAVEAIVARALAKEPADRFATMEEMAAALGAATGGLERAGDGAVGGAARPAPERRSSAARAGASSPEAARPASRLRRPAVVALAAVLVLAGLLAVPAVRQRLGIAAGGETDAGTAAGETGAVLDRLSAYQLLERGHALLERYDREGNIDLAIDRYRRALAAKPGYAAAHAGLAHAYWRRFRIADDPADLALGLAQARRAVELEPQLSAGRAALGLLLAESGQSSAARDEIETVLRLDPANPAALRGRARLAAVEGDLPAAIAALEAAVAAAPGSWNLSSALGHLHYRASDYEAAERAYRQAVELTPDNHEARKTLAASLHALGRYPEAAAELQAALAIRPEAGVYNNLGTLYFFQGLYEDSVASFERAVEMQPNEYLRWANLADGYRALSGRKEDAQDAYLRAIQLLDERLAGRPDDPVLRGRRALYLARRGDTAAALTALDALAATRPEAAAVRFRLALGYEIAGRREAALEALEGALVAGYSPVEVRGEPDLSALRADARYHRLASRFGG